jgi:hypothetical protein
MTLLLTVSLVWSLLALPVAVLVGRSARLAAERAQEPFRVDSVEHYLREQASAPLA